MLFSAVQVRNIWRIPSLGRWGRVQEHRLALVLLGAFVVVLLLGAIVPQRGALPPIEYGRWRQQYAPLSLWLEAAGLTASSGAPWLPIAGGLLMLSLVQCTVRRLAALARLWSRRGISTGSLGQLGSIVFHGSLLVGLGALLLSSAMRSAGQIELAPGMKVVDLPEQYLATQAGPWALPATALTIRLDDIRVDAWPDGSLKEQTAAISVLRQARLLARGDIGRTEALEAEGLTITLGSRAGPAVMLVHEGKGSRSSGWIHFPSWPGSSRSDLAFQVPETRLHLAATLEGATAARPEGARLTLRPIGNVQPGGEWRLKLGDAAQIGEHRLRFTAIDAWTLVSVVRDPFINWAFIAFGVGLAGLGLVFFTRVPGIESRAPEVASRRRAEILN